MNLFVKVGSVTNAQRSLSLLKSRGYSCEIKRIENPTAADGCGYALLVEAQSLEPVEILRRKGINVRGAEFL